MTTFVPPRRTSRGQPMRSVGRRRRRLLVGLLAVLAVGLAGMGAVAAGEPLHHAGVVVRHGDGRLTYAYVAFPEQTISGIQLLQRTGIPLVTIPFGGLGDAVCEIADEGCPASVCGRRLCQGAGADSPFWQYFRQVSPGEWQPLALGASATNVRDGDVDGWSWTDGKPDLPAVALADVAARAGVAHPAAEIAGSRPTPAVRTIYPAGVVPKPARSGQGTTTYVAAAVLIALIAGGALYATRHRRPGGRPA